MKTIYLVWGKWPAVREQEEKLLFISEDKNTAKSFIRDCKRLQEKLFKLEDEYTGMLEHPHFFGEDFRITSQFI
jgi:hypothetical protein